MKEETRELIRSLTEAFGPSGQEEQVRELITSLVRPHVDGVRTDALGNLICTRGPRRAGTAGGPPGTARAGTGTATAASGTAGAGGVKKVMLAAHMDEIGIMITHIDDKGFLRFGAIGGVSPHRCLGQRVVVGNGTLGVFGHEKLDDPKDLKFEKMFVDIGASSREEAGEKVRIGDAAAFTRPLQRAGNRLVAKAMDDRIGCAVLVEVARRLGASPHEVHFVFTVQEEVGLRGARTAAFGLAPDAAIAVDVTTTGDTPKAETMEVSLGKGAAIKVKDASLICHPGLRRSLEDTARAHGIPYQLEILERGGTDAGAMQLAREGVPAGVVSVPCRYVHTPSEMVDEGDVEACIELLAKALEGPLEW
ncbi:MAG: M42 family metallopeptidase [Bacillota bacterium]|nr:M42 family metallopeptidase [Bacillota bacterium]